MPLRIKDDPSNDPEDGECEGCGRYTRKYNRKLNSGMARSLIKIWNMSGQSPVCIPEVLDDKCREEAKLRFWGLLDKVDRRDAEGKNLGYWRITDAGKAFVLNQSKVKSHALVWGNRLVRLNGGMIGIEDALGKHFSYAELMAAEAA